MKRLFRFFLIAVIIAAAIWLAKSWWENNQNEERLIAETALIQKQINHTSKLVVTELSYAKVYTYEKNKKNGWNFLGYNKAKALLITEPKVQISYDLKKLEYELDPESKTIYITKIPKAEIDINPNISFYSVEDYVLNKFEAKDYNKIQKQVKAQIIKEVLRDDEIENAQNRLLTELSSIYVLSNSLGWKIVHEENKINSTKELRTVFFPTNSL